MKQLLSDYLSDQDRRRILGIQVGFLIDAIWAVTNLVMGVWQLSVWLITLGAYYMLFGLMRLIMLSCVFRPGGHTQIEARQIERLCGILFLVSIFILSGIVTLVMKDIGSFEYPGLFIYAMATFTFYSLAVSIVSYVKLRRHEDLLVITNSRVNLAVALVSLFATEIALLTTFSKGDDAELQFIMPILTGTGIAITICFLGVKSILDSNPKRQQK